MMKFTKVNNLAVVGAGTLAVVTLTGCGNNKPDDDTIPDPTDPTGECDPTDPKTCDAGDFCADDLVCRDITSNWMGFLKAAAGDVPITEWSLPGTYDSLSGDLTTTLVKYEDEEGIPNYGAGWVSDVIDAVDKMIGSQAEDPDTWRLKKELTIDSPDDIHYIEKCVGNHWKSMGQPKYDGLMTEGVQRVYEPIDLDDDWLTMKIWNHEDADVFPCQIRICTHLEPMANMLENPNVNRRQYFPNIAQSDDMKSVVKDLATSQHTSIADQLKAGMRSFDLRVTYAAQTEEFDAVENSESEEDAEADARKWWGGYATLTSRTVDDYLDEFKNFLDDHPQEIIYIAMSRAGDYEAIGAEQWDVEETVLEELWTGIQAKFSNEDGTTMLVDVKNDDLKFDALVEAGKRVVFYAADWERLTNSSDLAVNAAEWDNKSVGLQSDVAEMLDNNLKNFHDYTKSEEAPFAARSIAPEVHSDSLQTQAMSMIFNYVGWIPNFEQYDDLVAIPHNGNRLRPQVIIELPDPEEKRQECIHQWHIPLGQGQDNQRCYTSMVEINQMTNYYNQVALEESMNTNSTLPNVMYAGAVTEDGMLLIGSRAVDYNPENRDCSIDMWDICSVEADQGYQCAHKVGEGNDDFAVVNSTIIFDGAGWRGRLYPTDSDGTHWNICDAPGDPRPRSRAQCCRDVEKQLVDENGDAVPERKTPAAAGFHYTDFMIKYNFNLVCGEVSINDACNNIRAIVDERYEEYKVDETYEDPKTGRDGRYLVAHKEPFA